MCGIVGFTGKEKAVPYILDCLSRLEYRGYDSAGIALCGENGIEATKCAGKLSVLTSVLASKRKSEAVCGIGHTRWATHGSPDERNAHPHLSENGLFAVVHNGIIENYASIKNDLITKGYTFHSETDTEVIAHLLEENYDGDFISAVKKTLSRLEGSYAVAVLCRDYPDSIFCSRWGSPIVVGKNEKGSFISSDVTSLLEYTDEIYRLEGGESAFVNTEGFTFFDRDMRKIDKKSEKISWTVADAGKDGFEHFMLKEIYEQSETAEKTLSACVKDSEIKFEGADKLFDELSQVKRIMFVGCGSAFHVALYAKHITERLTGIYSSAEVASEWRYSASPLSDDCLAVFISQSGETADTLEALRKAKRLGAKTLGIVNVHSSSVASESDFVIYTKAGPEIAVATTKAYTAQFLTCYLMALKIGKIKGRLTDKEYVKLVSEAKESPDKISALLNNSAYKISSLAEEFFACEHIYYIGRGTDFAAAMEGALKLREVSYIPCEAYASGELKHGTISLIEKDSLVVALMGGEVAHKTFSNVKEVKSRGGRVIGVCYSSRLSDDEKRELDRIISLPCCEEIISGLYEGVVLQLFAYYVAKKRGCDIDKPRNLAKSVTVE